MTKKHSSLLTPSRREQGHGWIWLAFQLLLLPSVLQVCNSLLPVPLPAAALNFCFFGVNLGATLIIFRDFLGKSLSAAGKRFGPLVTFSALGFVLYWFCTGAVSLLIRQILPGFANVNDQSISALAGSHYVLTVIGTVLLVPAAEEVLYRGLVFGSLRRRSRFAAYCVSMVLFAFVHISGYLGSYDALRLALCFVQYLPAGFFLAWSYEKSGTVFAPIVIHTAVNALGVYSMR